MVTGNKQVGIAVTLQGTATFNKQAQEVVVSLNKINQATQNLSKQKVGAGGGAAGGGAGIGGLLSGGGGGAAGIAGIGIASGVATAGVVALGAAMAALAGAMATVVAMGAKYQKELGDIAAITNTTTEQMGKLDAKMKDISSRFPTSLGQMTEGSYALAQAGVEIKEQYEGALEAVNNFVMASGGEMGIADAAQVVGAALKSWRLEASEAKGVTNALTGVAISSAVTFKNVSNAFKQAVPSAVNLGYSYAELSAFLGVLGENFMRDTDAGTAFKQFLQKLQAPSKVSAELMKEWGISLYDAQGNAIGLRQVIERINQSMSNEAIALKGVTKAERDYAVTKIWGSDAGRVVLALLGRTPEAYDEMMRAIYRTDTQAIALAKTHGLLIPQLTVLKNQIVNFGTSIGQQVAPALANLTETINYLFRRMDPQVPAMFGKAIAGMFKGFDLAKLEEEAQKVFGPETARTYMSFIKVLNSIRDVFANNIIPSVAAFAGVIGKVFSNAGIEATGFSNAITFVGKVVGTLIDILSVLAAGTLTAVVVGFKLVGEGIVLLGEGFNKLVEIVGGVVNDVSSYWQQMDFSIEKIIVDILHKLASFISGLSGVPEAADSVYQSWVAAWTGLGGFTSKILQFVGDTITRFLNWLKTLPIIGGAITAVEGFLAGVGAGVGDAFEGMSKTVGDTLGKVGYSIERVIQDIERMKSDAQESMSGFARAMRGGVSEAAAFDQAMLDVQNSMKKVRQQAGDDGGEGWYPDIGGSGAKEAKQDIDELAKAIMKMMDDVPGMTMDLAKFMAELEIEDPGRLAPMMVALRTSKDLLGQMLIAKEAILAVDIQIMQSEQRMAALQAQRSALEIKIREVELSYQRQILDVRMQQYAIDQKLWPLRDKLTGIEREMNKLMRENLDLTKRRTEAELEALPYRYKIRDLEQQIEDIHDKKLALIRREQELLMEGALAGTTRQLENAQEDLDAAWDAKNVKSILAAEQAVKGLTAAQRSQQKALDEIQNAQAQTARDEELKTIPLEREKILQEEILKPIERRLELIAREAEEQGLRNELVRIGLEAEKRLLEEQIQVLEDQRAKLDRVIEGLNIEMAVATLAYQQELIELNKVILEEEKRRQSLDETKKKNDEVFGALIAEFLDVMIQSGAFTADESLQVAQRLKMWDDQIAKIAEVAQEFARVQGEANKVKTAIDNIPREVTITITTVYKEIHEGSSGSTDPNDPNNPPKPPELAHGGIIPGLPNIPSIITAHGGEEVVSFNDRQSIHAMMRSIYEMTAITMAMIARVYEPTQTSFVRNPMQMNPQIVNNNYDYVVNASYEKQQSPISIKHDLRALVEMTRR